MNIKVYKKGKKVKLSPFFNSLEFDCKCKRPECKETLIDLNHVARLDRLRVKLDKPIKITSAYRCKDHNKEIGGAKNSQHPKGTATDIILQMKPSDVANACEDIFDGIGRYNTFTHVDSRGHRARWGNVPTVDLSPVKKEPEIEKSVSQEEPIVPKKETEEPSNLMRSLIRIIEWIRGGMK